MPTLTAFLLGMAVGLMLAMVMISLVALRDDPSKDSPDA